MDMSKEEYASGAMVKKELKVKTGVDKETAKKIVKAIKDSKLKVSPSQMDEMVRVTGKKIDDLQADDRAGRQCRRLRDQCRQRLAGTG